MNELAPLLRLGPTLVAALAIWALTTAWLSWCGRTGRDRLAFWPLAAVASGAALFWAAQVGVDWDESEHLHAAWRVAVGERPFVDFWQHHSPTLWFVTSPLAGALGESPWLIPVARALSTIATIIAAWIAWRLARRLHGDVASPSRFVFLFAAGAITWQFAWLRPDVPALLLLLGAGHACVDVAEGRRRGALLAGAMLALAWGFAPKQLAFAVLPLGAIVLGGIGPGRRDRLPHRLGAFGIGLVLGAAPLVGVLLQQDLAHAFWQNVVRFNAQHVGPGFPFGPAWLVLGTAAAVAAWRRSDRSAAGSVLVVALALVTLGSVVAVQHTARYHLAPWMVLVAVLACGADVPAGLGGLGGRVRPAVIGLLCALLLVPGLRQAWNARGELSQDIARRTELLAVSRGESVLCVHPDHPIARPDATRLHSTWQLRFTRRNQLTPLEPDTGAGFLDRMRAARPAVVVTEIDQVPIAEALAARGVLSEAEALELKTLLSSAYALRVVAGRTFYVAE